MKRIFMPIAAAALLLSTPAVQAASVSQPVEVTVTGNPSDLATTAVTSVPATTEAASGAVTKVVKAKKLSFFAKAKQLLRHFGGNKSQIVAALLAFFLGGFGVHRFYLGYTWQGLVQLLGNLGGLGIYAAGIASAVTAAAGGTVAFPALAVVGLLITVAIGIWVLVDFIRILIGSLQPKNGSYDKTF